MVKDRLGIIVDVNLLSSDGKDYIEVSVQQSHNPISMRESTIIVQAVHFRNFVEHLLIRLYFPDKDGPGIAYLSRDFRQRVLTLSLSIRSRKSLSVASV